MLLWVQTMTEGALAADTDYIDENHVYSGRLPVWYALRDCLG